MINSYSPAPAGDAHDSAGGDRRLRHDQRRRHDRRVSNREPRADVDASAPAAEKFYDLVIEVAIVRPGPIQGDMVHPYLKRREGWRRSNTEGRLCEVLKKTLGCRCFRNRR